MHIPKIYWLLDGVFATTPPRYWEETIHLSNGLISAFGNHGFDHIVLNPIESFRKAVRKLVDLPEISEVKTVLDLTGWIGPGLKPLFPDAEIFTDFSLSRVIDVATKDFRRVGYRTNLPQDEIVKRATELDLSKVLIVDDTGISGRTSELTMRAFGIQPTNAMHLFLLGNRGYLPTADTEPVKPGSIALLEGLGCKVVYGDSLETPLDDAEHLQDTFDHPDIEIGFSAALRLRSQGRASQPYRDQLHDFLSQGEPIENLFPQLVELEELERPSKAGRFIRNPSYPPSEASIYSLNPFLWTFSEFWGKVDEARIYERREDVLGFLRRLQLLSTSQEGDTSEIRNALMGETQSILPGIMREGKITREK